MSGVPLVNGEVRVWHYALDAQPQTQAALASVLDEAERCRADRFHFEEHRRRFIVRRGVLRLILSRCTGTAPEAICFDGGATGKPRIAWPMSARALKFSTSSSQDLGAMAVAYDCQLGIDVEQVRFDRDHDLIAREFAGEEAARLRRMQPKARAVAFFDLWTCKEAYLKAKGLGLSVPLNRFAIAADPVAPRLTWSELDVSDPQCWSLHRLVLASGFAACLAVAGGCRDVSCDRFVL